MSTNKNTGIGAVGIASTYVGTVIGAGYASGQEILQFFNAFYEKGLIGILLGTVLFIVAAYVPMMLGRKLNTPNYTDVISLGKSKLPLIFSDVVVAFTLFSTLTIMVAASGTTFNQTFGLPLVAGGIIMCVLMVLNLFAGIEGISKVLSYVVPVMVVGAFAAAIYFTINPAPVVDATKEVVVNSSPLIKHWTLSGPLYVAFNYVVAVAVNVTLGHQAKDLKAIKNGALSGGLILGLCAFGLYTALGKNLHVIGTSALPMVDLANTVSSTLGSVYSIVLFLGLYSTAISCFFGVYQRFTTMPGMMKFGNNALIIGIAAASLVLSMVGFTNLIGYVYPAIGYCGLIILGMNCYRNAKTKDTVVDAVQEEVRQFVPKKQTR